MLFVGIDPGEEWCGVGVLYIGRKEITCDAAVYNVSDHSYLALAAAISGLPRWSEEIPKFIIEDYHVRPVGHQAFTRGLTLRFIGALEYACAMRSDIEFAQYNANFVNPGKPEETYSIFGGLMHPWRDQWHGDTRWNHAMSAWRVIGMHLLKHYPHEVKRLRSLKHYSATTYEKVDDGSADDLYADSLVWIAPAQLKKVR